MIGRCRLSFQKEFNYFYPEVKLARIKTRPLPEFSLFTTARAAGAAISEPYESRRGNLLIYDIIKPAAEVELFMLLFIN